MSSDAFRLDGQVALIAGVLAARGLGRAIALSWPPPGPTYGSAIWPRPWRQPEHAGAIRSEGRRTGFALSNVADWTISKAW